MDITTQIRAGVGEAGLPNGPTAQSRPVQAAREVTLYAGHSDEPKLDRQSIKEELGVAISRVQDFAQSLQRNLSFSIDDDSGRIVVEVKDSVSGEVIRQIPSEEALRMLDYLEQARSLLFHATA